MNINLKKKVEKENLLVKFVFENKFKEKTDDYFKGELNQIFLIYNHEGHKRVLLLGLGKEDELTLEKIRRLSSLMTKTTKSLKLTSLTIQPIKFKDFSEFEIIQAVTESIILANYSYNKKTDKKDKIKDITSITFITKENLKKDLETTNKICKNVLLIRDLVNESSYNKNSLQLTTKIKQIASSHKLKIKILDEKQLKRLGMNLILAVNAGSSSPARLVILEYNGNTKSKKKIAIVGKGITFDTGGINLKPTGYIETMKSDMAGAATALAIIKTAKETNLKQNIIAVMPLTDNPIDAKAFKPGDIFQAYNKKTVEIGNTDAEGRLILADSLAYTIDKYKPSLIIDLATLTGSCAVALGNYAAGLLTNNDKQSKNLIEAANSTGEIIWQLPIYDEMREAIKGSFADICNTSSEKGYGGALTAAAFLENFVDKTPWIHLDIAGPGYLEKEHHYISKGGTGFALRSIINFLKNY